MPLQNNRRHRTAKKIQAKAVELAMRDGLANTTTEAIAREAGISTRTFFNYYPYKEAAIMGPPPDYPADQSEDFVTSRGHLIDDLQVLIAAHLRRFESERAMMANVLALADTDPKVDALRANSILSRRAQMRDLLMRRLPSADDVMIDVLASAIIAVTNRAARDWTQGNKDDLVTIARNHLSKILPAAELLNRDR